MDVPAPQDMVFFALPIKEELAEVLQFIPPEPVPAPQLHRDTDEVTKLILRERTVRCARQEEFVEVLRSTVARTR